MRTRIVTLLLLILTFVVTYPSIWAVMNSLKTAADRMANPAGLPRTLDFDNYVEAWVKGQFGKYMLNSVIISIPSVVAVLILSVLAGYAFAHFKFRGKDILYGYVVAGLSVPFVVIIIPLFFEMRDFGLLNTHLAVILPQVAIILPFGVVLTRNFMLDVPTELLEAGIMDGCGELRVLTAIVLPVIRPALSSLVVFSFMWTWNQLFLPMVMITQTELRPLPVGLTYFQGQYGTNIPVIAAAAIIASLPVVVMYWLFQRQFVRGLTLGAVKG
jgi:ABC-type glycerol-3-phosphate transport system permease component